MWSGYQGVGFRCYINCYHQIKSGLADQKDAKRWQEVDWGGWNSCLLVINLLKGGPRIPWWIPKMGIIVRVMSYPAVRGLGGGMST